ncbi:MAG: hypothetical protein JRE70_19890 [Deltaproteobacteria bacterium]|nr:hypothetical protein [Deltaproteobacteria bacterium]
MSGGARFMWHSVQRGVDGVFERFSARPLGIVVFAASVALLVQLQMGGERSFRADAVASAQSVDHPARVSSYIEKVWVKAGDVVEPGAPLVDLSPHFIDRELVRVDARIEKLLHESRLAQARLLVKEQRWVEPEMRMRPDRPSLEGPTEALYAGELALLQTRRNQLQQDRENLTILSRRSGRVLIVAAPGSSVGAGSSVASINPNRAEEIIAYVPADTNPDQIATGAPVRIATTSPSCRGDARVLRLGAGVEEAPGQLRSFLRFPMHGMPVYISIPSECQLGIGQVLVVEFPRAVL